MPWYDPRSWGSPTGGASGVPSPTTGSTAPRPAAPQAPPSANTPQRNANGALAPQGVNTGTGLNGGRKVLDWLGERGEGPPSDIGPADRNNFQLPGADERGDFLRGGAQNAQGRMAPQSANDSQFRGYQDSLAQRLGRQVNGEESLSNLQLRNATDQNIAQQRSLAASASPGNAAMAQRLAGQNIGAMNQGYGAQAAQLGIQERNAAANALAGLSGQARGQDLQNNQFNVGAQLNQRNMNDQFTQGMSGLELANAQGVQRGNMGYEQNQTQRYGIDKGVPVQPQNWERVVGAAAGVAPLFMAEGGIVTQPTNTVIGEAGPEAVIPLNTPERWGLIQRLSSPDAGTMSKMAFDPYAMQAPREGFERDMRTGRQVQTGDKKDAMKAKGLESLMGLGKPKEAKPTESSPAWQQLVASINGFQPMAEGGVVTQPTKALVGEAGPEAVIPLPYLPELLERLQLAQQRQQLDQQLKHQGKQGLLDASGHANRAPFDAPGGITHERDYIRERPFVAAGQAKTAQDEADYLKRYATNMYGVNR